MAKHLRLLNSFLYSCKKSETPSKSTLEHKVPSKIDLSLFLTYCPETQWDKKVLKDERIVLVEEDQVITADTDLAEIFKDHLENIVESLHNERPCKVDFDREPVANAIKNFSQHPSILKIKENRILLPVSRFAQ